MEQVQKDFERLRKRSEGTKCIDDVQATIDLLKEARDAIEKDPKSASLTLAKLQNPVKASFEATNKDLKETYNGLNRYTKALDKLFKDKPLPTTEYDALSSQPGLVNRAVAIHLLREGQFGVVNSFLEEVSKAAEKSEPANKEAEKVPDYDSIRSGNIRKQFVILYEVLNEIVKHENLTPAIKWARLNRVALEARGSNLEFELCRLQFLWLFRGPKDKPVQVSVGRKRALEYARKEFAGFQHRYLREVQQLLGAMAFAPNIEESPYKGLFSSLNTWDDIGGLFISEFNALFGVSAHSPIHLAATAGAIALPTLLKLQTIMKEKRTEWTSQNELPVEIPLPPAYQYHSIFVCPVSKEQTTDKNPPMLLPCGHVIAQESLARLSKGTRFKCPYCPTESHPREARKLIL